MKSTALIALLALLGCCFAMRQQSVAVTGKLRCGTSPASGVSVKLWDEDDGDLGIDPDDLLSQGFTDAQGFFHLKGSERELTSIDPVLKVYHNCGEKVKIGQRKVKFRIPKSYISEGGHPIRTFDIGVINLETIFAQEERDFMRFLLALTIVGCSLSIRQQTVAVSGRLICGDKSAVGVSVMLFDEDDGLDVDDILDEGYTDASGRFFLTGSERELTNIDPVVKVYHDCDDGMVPGQRKLKFYIPDAYISSGRVAKKVFNLGVINLQTIFPSEGRNFL
uniref:Transthyretin-like family protein n=1 Tax=Angiostrongylus cantonensis TaxID=6313 RepID=A0A0K0DEG6_ANGCA